MPSKLPLIELGECIVEQLDHARQSQVRDDHSCEVSAASPSITASWASWASPVELSVMRVPSRSKCWSCRACVYSCATATLSVGPNGLITPDDVEATRLGPVVGGDLRAVQLDQQCIQVGVGGQQAKTLEGALFGRLHCSGVVSSNVRARARSLSKLVAGDEARRALRCVGCSWRMGGTCAGDRIDLRGEIGRDGGPGVGGSTEPDGVADAGGLGLTTAEVGGGGRWPYRLRHGGRKARGAVAAATASARQLAHPSKICNERGGRSPERREGVGIRELWPDRLISVSSPSRAGGFTQPT